MIYTNKFINLISFLITCFIFFIIYFIFNFNLSNIQDISNFPQEKIINIISKIESPFKEKKKENSEGVNLGDWYIEIPSINLQAPIAEGVDENTLNTKVGHFENTACKNGNIGLAGHNRGYEFNYFKDLKELKIDDKIIYTYKNFKRTYIIKTMEIINSSDWSYLEDTSKNTLTLITCVENEPQFRRCVQAVEI